jgi:hypothetical protein
MSHPPEGVGVALKEGVTLALPDSVPERDTRERVEVVDPLEVAVPERPAERDAMLRVAEAQLEEEREGPLREAPLVGEALAVADTVPLPRGEMLPCGVSVPRPVSEMLGDSVSEGEEEGRGEAEGDSVSEGELEAEGQGEIESEGDGEGDSEAVREGSAVRGADDEAEARIRSEGEVVDEVVPSGAPEALAAGDRERESEIGAEGVAGREAEDAEEGEGMAEGEGGAVGDAEYVSDGVAEAEREPSSDHDGNALELLLLEPAGDRETAPDAESEGQVEAEGVARPVCEILPVFEGAPEKVPPPGGAPASPVPLPPPPPAPTPGEAEGESEALPLRRSEAEGRPLEVPFTPVAVDEGDALEVNETHPDMVGVATPVKEIVTAPLSVGGVAEGDAVSDGDAEALGDGVSLGEGVGEGDGSAVAESKAESDAPADSVGAPVAVGAPRLPVAPPLCDGAMVKVGAPVHEALAVAVVPLRPPDAVARDERVARGDVVPLRPLPEGERVAARGVAVPLRRDADGLTEMRATLAVALGAEPLGEEVCARRGVAVPSLLAVTEGAPLTEGEPLSREALALPDATGDALPLREAHALPELPEGDGAPEGVATPERENAPVGVGASAVALGAARLGDGVPVAPRVPSGERLAPTPLGDAAGLPVPPSPPAVALAERAPLALPSTLALAVRVRAADALAVPLAVAVMVADACTRTGRTGARRGATANVKGAVRWGAKDTAALQQLNSAEAVHEDAVPDMRYNLASRPKNAVPLS